jgi:tRNA(adenine34) deaminase
MSTDPMQQHVQWMRGLLDVAHAAAADGEAPIAAMVVQNGVALGVGRNTKTSRRCGFAHAELNALLASSGELGRKPTNAAIYVTLEPCAMCLGAIIFSGIRTLVYGADDPDGGAVRMFREDPLYREWLPEIVRGVLQQECEALKRLPTWCGPTDAVEGPGEPSRERG